MGLERVTGSFAIDIMPAMATSLTYSIELSPLARLQPVTPAWTRTFEVTPFLVLAVLTLLVLIVIAMLQSRRAVHGIRMELFQRRYAVYESTRHLCHSISSTGAVEARLLDDFRRSTARTRWLFDREIHEYVHEHLYAAAVRQDQLSQAFANMPQGRHRDTSAIQQSQVRSWFHQQAALIDCQFAPFLQLKSIRS